jgi:hypothetical protein
MAERNDQTSVSQDAPEEQVADPDRTIFGPGGLLVPFLNKDPASLDEPTRELQAAIREVVGYTLAAKARGQGEDWALELRLRDAMDVLCNWYDQHHCLFDLFDWERLPYAPPTSMFAPATDIAGDEHAATLAAFDLWLVLLLIDRSTYRSGSGSVFSFRQQRVRLLRCRVCGRYQQRWYGRGAEDAVCDECRAQRSGGSRAREYQNKKLKLRVRWLVEVWEREHWSRVGGITPVPAGRARYELEAPNGVLRGWIYGKDPDAEKQLFCQALELFEEQPR